MTRSRSHLAFFTIAGLLFVARGAIAVHAQAQGFAGNPLLRTALSGDETKEAVIGTAEFAPGGTTGRHTHPGDEYGVVLQGTLEFRLDGREPRRASAGEAFHNPRGVVHETRNVGEGTARVASTFILDKDKPLMQPAP
ncbi:MAG: cupin domain-containing protein [Deltaproteobacteria bacterium]|nr:cupin domain-containing protein [Deltaproteobacteria bacterium]